MEKCFTSLLRIHYTSENITRIFSENVRDAQQLEIQITSANSSLPRSTYVHMLGHSAGEQKKDSVKTDKRYDLYDHRAWVDEKNEVVSHFGIDPNHLKIDRLRFDDFTQEVL